MLIARAASPGASQDRADIFARGEHAVLVVADGAGGTGDGAAAADAFMDRVRDAVLDPDFDLLAPRRWEELFKVVDASLRAIGETTAVVVVHLQGMLVCVASGDSEAWVIGATEVDRLTDGTPRARLGSGGARPKSVMRRALTGTLVVATDGLFRHVEHGALLARARTEPFGRVADALLAMTELPSGERADDVAVLVGVPT